MKQIYFNHDGNIDDLVSYLLLLQAPDIKLLGVGAIDADGYIDPSVEACRKMTDLFNLRGDDLTIARSNSRAVNQFPHEWRMATYSFNYLPMLNESGKIDTQQAKLPAHLDMVEKIKEADEPIALVMTGPLTDLARALDVDPDIEKNFIGWVVLLMGTATLLWLTLTVVKNGTRFGIHTQLNAYLNQIFQFRWSD